ncbi:hypothetical protein [Parabacteroides massiliensis]|uniref:hypothetical protein n=1 Tax=Parabacteroides massiliensis TaxID=1750560 RepID=UPI00096A63F2|nr:hypothetical protein [Parabacteroides massiliensis]
MVKIELVILISIINLFSCFSRKIDNYLKLTVSAMSDTVSYGDSLQLDIIFENISDKECLFYPKANLILENNDIIEILGIDDNRFYEINNVIDLTFIQKIPPKHRYKMTYFISVDSLYLSKGENTLFLSYIFRRKYSDKFKYKYVNKRSLYGRLKSNLFMLYVE